MSDQNVPNPDQTEVPAAADSAPTDALQLADQQPVTVESSGGNASRPDHTRTILEVVGGVVAAGMILVAGALGFIIGHATGGDDVRMDRVTQPWNGGPEAGGPGFGPGQDGGRDRGTGPGGGQRHDQGDGQQGFGGRHHMEGDQGFGRGADPDGDNWTGRGQYGPGTGPGQGPGTGPGQAPGQAPGQGPGQAPGQSQGDNATP